jgi:hypothetical protein
LLELFPDGTISVNTWNLVARLGPGAFETIGGHVVNVALLALTSTKHDKNLQFSGIDASIGKEPSQKAALLRSDQPTVIHSIDQNNQLQNPDAVIQLEKSLETDLLSQTALAYQGIATADNPSFVLSFWFIVPK